MPDVIFNPVIFRPSILNTRIACSFISGKGENTISGEGGDGMEISWNSPFLKEPSMYPNVRAIQDN